MPKSVYDEIKKKHGEAFAKELRDFDNGIFEIPNIVKMLKFAGYDAGPIKYFLSALKMKASKSTVNHKGLNPFELLKKAGYDAFYADTLKKQNSISKYFMKGAKLCTFSDPTRFKKYHIVHCIKEGAERIKPFKNPTREDEYATSVISIQILKNGTFLKITNRYNHLVENPDNTFRSNPDRIIPGLSEALEEYFNCPILKDVFIPEGYAFINKHLLKFNEEFMNKYIGEQYYCLDGKIVEIDRDKEVIIDNYVFNIKERSFKKIIKSLKDSGFVEALMKEIEGKSLQFKTRGKRGIKALYADGIKIFETDDGVLRFLNLPTTTKIGDNFIKFDRYLKYFFAPRLQEIGNGFLSCNRAIECLHLPLLQKVGNCFLMFNSNLKCFSAPLLKKTGTSFLSDAGYGASNYAVA